MKQKTNWDDFFEPYTSSPFCDIFFADTFRMYNKKVFSLPSVSKWEDLPDSPGVYFVSTDYDGDCSTLNEVICYVGMSSVSLVKRWAGHKLNKHPFKKIYYLEVYGGDLEHLEAIENHFIGILMPKFNERGMGQVNTGLGLRRSVIYAMQRLIINPVFSSPAQDKFHALCVCGAIGPVGKSVESAKVAAIDSGFAIFQYRMHDDLQNALFWLCPDCQSNKSELSPNDIIRKLNKVIGKTVDHYLPKEDSENRFAIKRFYDLVNSSLPSPHLKRRSNPVISV